MSTQREILPRIIGELREANPECGIVLMGSVFYGYERPESDIDLFVVVKRDPELRIEGSKVIHEEKGMKLIETCIEGITVHFACWPAASLQNSLNEEPYVFYPFSQGEILSDPRGLAEYYRQVALDYFEANPAITNAWARQLDELKRHKLDPSYKLEFPEWGDFAGHIGRRIQEIE